MHIDPTIAVMIIIAIIVGVPCLLVRPLFLAIADRIAGKKSNARELDEMKRKIAALENEVRTLRVQVIGIESNQEFSNKLLENLKSDAEETKSKSP